MIAFIACEEVLFGVFFSSILNGLHVDILALTLAALEHAICGNLLSRFLHFIVSAIALRNDACYAVSFLFKGTAGKNCRVHCCHLDGSNLTINESTSEFWVLGVTEVRENGAYLIRILFRLIIEKLVYLVLNVKCHFCCQMFSLLGCLLTRNQINKLLSNSISHCVPCSYCQCLKRFT